MEDRYEIKMLYFEDCPLWKRARENLEIVLKKFHLDAIVDLIRVETDQRRKTIALSVRPASG